MGEGLALRLQVRSEVAAELSMDRRGVVGGWVGRASLRLDRIRRSLFLESNKENVWCLLSLGSSRTGPLPLLPSAERSHTSPRGRDSLDVLP